MYPGPQVVTVDPGPLGDRLEGAERPGHFRGVLTVVAKLLHVTGPCRAYFGEKDAQQLVLVRSMVSQLDFPAEVAACPTVRDADGLACSSRNAYLSPEERRAAVAVPQALEAAVRLAAAGERSSAAVRAAMRGRIQAEPSATLVYAMVVDDRTWEEPETIDGPARAVLAVRFGSTRLIDNAALSPPGPDAVSTGT